MRIWATQAPATSNRSQPVSKGIALDSDEPAWSSPRSWNELPPELWLRVLRFLTAIEGQPVKASCTLFRQLVMEPSFSWMAMKGYNPKVLVLNCIPSGIRNPIGCIIRRVRSLIHYPHYFLHSRYGELLLAAKCRGSEFLISTDGNDFTPSSPSIVGKVKKNFLCTNYVMHNCVESLPGTADEPPAYPELGVIHYDMNIMGMSPADQQMQVHVPRTIRRNCSQAAQPRRLRKCPTSADGDCMKLVLQDPYLRDGAKHFFLDGLTPMSPKNFVLVSAAAPHDAVLELSMCDRDHFVMTPCHPLCLLQAFAICLTRLDSLHAC